MLQETMTVPSLDRRRMPRGGARLRLFLVASLALSPLAWSVSAAAQDAEKPPGILIDRVVVRWYADEIGGAAQARSILSRELAFEARLEALAEGAQPDEPLLDRHIREALDRHIAESLLAALPISPHPTPKDVADRAESARRILAQQCGGNDRIARAAALEGISSDEYSTLLRRRARASLYLDRMIAPMLEPTEQELRDFHASGATKLSSEPFDEVIEEVRRVFIASRLRDAIDEFFQNARSRITIRVL